MIPQPFIEELLKNTDIVEWIDSYVPLKKMGTSYVACCPFHQEKNPSFNVIPKKQFYHCFGCGVSGNAISFAMNYLHQSFPEAINTLALRAGMSVPREDQPQRNVKQNNLYHVLANVSTLYQKNLHKNNNAALNYLKNRGVSAPIAQSFQLGFAPPGWHHLTQQTQFVVDDLLHTGMLVQKEDGKKYDRYRDRLMFPIHDRHGRIIGFGGRTLDDEQKPKYLNSPETVLFQKNRELYGLHHALQHPIQSILVVEGYMDVIALAQHGIHHAVATLGTATSAFHLQLLSKHTQHLVFCFDGDQAGQKAAWRALENSLTELHTGITPYFVFLPEGHDPDSFVRAQGAQAFLDLVHNAIPLHTFFFNTLTTDHDDASLVGKSQLMNMAMPYVQKMAEGPYKQLMLEELSRKTHIESHRIAQLINRTNTPALPQTTQTIKRTPARVAMALLLQNPSIYQEIKTKVNPQHLDQKKYPVFIELLHRLENNPTITTAILIEHWRETPWFDSMSQLAIWAHGVPQDAMVQELTDTLQFLIKQTQDSFIQKCIEKARTQQLTSLERHALQKMLQQKHIKVTSKD